MDIKYYLAVLKSNKWAIFITVAVAMIVVIVGTLMITPIYSASTTLRIATSSGSSVSYTDISYADRLMNTYTKIATSRPVLDELVTKLNLQSKPDVKVITISSTELMKITVNSPDPAIAQSAANALAEILSQQSQELYSGGEKSTAEILGEQLTLAEDELNQARLDYENLIATSPDDSESITQANMVIELKTKTYETLLDQYDAARLREALRANIITIVEPAVLPQKPSQPKIAMNIMMGFIVGLVGGLGVAFLFENLNPRLYTLEQVETVSELDVIGKIPSVKRPGLAGLFNRTLNTNNVIFKEAFHKLQVKITQQNTNGHSMKSILFTSAIPGEGKSTVVTNLAIAFAQTGKKVIIVDCDMRRPVIHKLIGLPNELGLSTILRGGIPQSIVLQKSRYPNTWVLTSGPIPPNPVELLGSPQMKALFDVLTKNYDLVILDTPASTAGWRCINSINNG